MHLEQFQSLLDQVSKVETLALTIVDFVTHVRVLSFEEVHDWKDLSVVWHKGFSNGVRAGNETLQDLQGDCDDFAVSGVKGGFNWDDELWNNWKDLGATFVKHVEHTLNCEESVWVNLFTNSLKENWQVMMIIKLLNINFPVDFVLRTMLNGDWEISSIIEQSELTLWNMSCSDCSCSWFLRNWFSLWLEQAGCLASKTLTFLQDSGS